MVSQAEKIYFAARMHSLTPRAKRLGVTYTVAVLYDDMLDVDQINVYRTTRKWFGLRKKTEWCFLAYDLMELLENIENDIIDLEGLPTYEVIQHPAVQKRLP